MKLSGGVRSAGIILRRRIQTNQLNVNTAVALKQAPRGSSMTLTVEFEIQTDGICDDCAGEFAGICRPFKRVIKKSYPNRKEACAECNAYREREFLAPPRPEQPQC